MAPPSTPDERPTASHFDDIVTVKVGSPEPKPYLLHKGALSFYSGYFDAALKANFKEGRDGVVELLTEDTQTFDFFVQWLYTRRLPEASKTGDQFKELCKLWLLADRSSTPLLANMVINALRDEIVRLWMVPTTSLKMIYENTSENAGLRRFAVHIIAHTGGPALLQDAKRGNYPPDALWDILRVVWKMQGAKVESMQKAATSKLDLCEFHTHEEGVKCTKTAA